MNIKRNSDYSPVQPFNQLGFIIQTQCVYSEVGTDFIIQGNLRLNTMRTSDADLRFYITTVQDG